jgi:hypothetical protein
MNRLLFSILLLSTVSLIAYGQSESHKSRHPVAQQLIQLEREWSRADFRQEVPAIKRLIAEDWTGTTSRGQILNRSQMLDEVLAVKAEGDSSISDTRVRVYGKTAIVTGLLTTNNPPTTGEAIRKRFTDVWLNTKAGWRCIASHGSYVK